MAVEAMNTTPCVIDRGGQCACMGGREGDLVTPGGDGLECDEERIGTASN